MLLKQENGGFAVSIIILFYQWFTKFTILAIILISLDIPFTWFWHVHQTMDYLDGHADNTHPGASGGAEAAFLVLFKGSLSGDLPNLIVSTWRFFYLLFYFNLIGHFIQYAKGPTLWKKGQQGNSVFIQHRHKLPIFIVDKEQSALCFCIYSYAVFMLSWISMKCSLASIKQNTGCVNLNGLRSDNLDRS